MNRALIAIALLALTSCAGSPVIVAQASDCAQLLPASWRQPVAPPDMPEGSTVGEWIAFGDQAIGKLDMANGRTADAIGIVERCEARSKAAVKKSRSRFLGIF